MTFSPPKIDFCAHDPFAVISTKNRKNGSSDPNKIEKCVQFSENMTMFDSEKLMIKPISFKNLSIDDFDLYCTTMHYVATHFGFLSECGEVIVDANRLERSFRLTIVSKKTIFNQYLFSIYERNENSIPIEIAMNVLNITFCLIIKQSISYDDFRRIETIFKNMFSEALKDYKCFQWKMSSLDRDSCPPEVLFVLRAILSKFGTASSVSDTIWFRNCFRGYRIPLLRKHSELLFF